MPVTLIQPRLSFQRNCRPRTQPSPARMPVASRQWTAECASRSSVWMASCTSTWSSARSAMKRRWVETSFNNDLSCYLTAFQRRSSSNGLCVDVGWRPRCMFFIFSFFSLAVCFSLSIQNAYFVMKNFVENLNIMHFGSFLSKTKLCIANRF